MSLRKLERAYGVAALPATIDTHPDPTAKLPVGTNHPKTQDLCSGGEFRSTAYAFTGASHARGRWFETSRAHPGRWCDGRTWH